MATYTIKKGDTLSRIAAANGTTIDELVRLNNISNPDVIQAGANLTLPGGEAETDTGTSTTDTAVTPPTTADTLAGIEGNMPTYQQSEALMNALAELQTAQANKPADYVSPYADQIQEGLAALLGREPFSYDLNSDPTYQQYKAGAIRNGQLAMQDTMGQAAQLTGGFGNTYAQTAGQQAYNNELSELNDIVPQLQQSALAGYEAEGDQMLTDIGVLQGLDESAYGRSQDEQDAYYADLQFKADRADTMSEDEWNKHLADLSVWQSNRDYYYGKSQDELAQSNYENELALAAAAKTGGRGNGGDGGDDGDESDTPSEMYETAKTQAIRKAKIYASGGGTDPLAYVAYMANNGYITEAEADEIGLMVQAIISSSTYNPAYKDRNATTGSLGR